MKIFSGLKQSKPGKPSQVGTDVSDLARQYGVSEQVMNRFVQRFSPDHVAAGQFAEEADIVLFIHIPKTAGMSVGRSLQHSFDIFHGVEWSDIQKSFRRQTREACYRQTQMPGRQVIMGHFGWQEMQIWRMNEMPMKCASILREPVARFVSNYNYNCSDAHPDNENFRKRFPTMMDFARGQPYDFQVSQMTGTNASFENLLEKLVHHYTFLGITEKLSASLKHLAVSHGLPAPTEFRENVGKIRPDAGPDPEVVDIIEKKNANDRRLHSLLSRLYA